MNPHADGSYKAAPCLLHERQQESRPRPDRALRVPSPQRKKTGRADPGMAANTKCLARNNKSRMRAETTKRRMSQRGYSDMGVDDEH